MSILSPKCRIRLVSALVACLIAIAALMPPQAQAQANGVVPYQFIAKLYSEALGRGPDPAGWQNWVNTFMEDGCQLSTLQSVATTFYTVPEFTSQYASDTTYQAQVIAIYRGVLNRDADQGGLQHWASLAQSNGWSYVVSQIVGSQELVNDEPTICSPTRPDYGFGGYGPQNNFQANTNYPPPAPTPVLTGSGAGYVPANEAALQSKLNSMSSGQILCLSQDQLIWLTQVLTIPSGVTLTTCGLTQGPYNGDIPYAQMARLARSASFSGNEQVDVDAGATMNYVWSDGQRNMLGSTGNGTHNDFNVITEPGAGITLSYNRISEAQGAMLVGLNPGNCTLTMQYNLLTAYTSAWDPNPEYPSDGIDDYCENATIANNWLIDMTDVGILAMGLWVNGAADNQLSQIDNNTIVQAGNGDNAAICLDQNTDTGGGGHALSYASGSTNMTMNGNIFWTSPATTTGFGICAGTAEWNMNTPPWNTSTGGVFTSNGTPNTSQSLPPLTVNARAGTAVSYGTYSVDIASTNSVNANVVNFVTSTGSLYPGDTGCPGGAVIEDPGATGSLPNATYTGTFTGCRDNAVLGNNYQLADPNFATGTVYRGWSVGIGNGLGSASDVYVQDTWNGSVFTGYNNGSYSNPYELVISDPSNPFFVSAYQSVYGFTSGHSFTVTVEAEASSGLLGSGGYLAVFDPGNGNNLCATYITNQSSWTQLTCPGTVPADGELQVQLGSGNGSGSGEPAGAWVKFDNVTLTVN